MSCERYATALREHAIGAPLDRAAEAHLDACAACRIRLEHDRRAMARLDEELAGALAVEPSGDFHAQVRMRIDEEAGPARLRLRPIVLAAVASVVVVVVGVMLSQSDRGVPPTGEALQGRDVALAPELAPPNSAREDAMPPDIRQPAAVAATSVARSFSSATAVERSSSSATVEPEVIVPPDRAEAIRRYVNAVAEGRVLIPEGALPKTSASGPVIAPLTVEPILIPAFEDTPRASTVEGLT